MSTKHFLAPILLTITFLAVSTRVTEATLLAGPGQSEPGKACFDYLQSGTKFNYVNNCTTKAYEKFNVSANSTSNVTCPAMFHAMECMNDAACQHCWYYDAQSMTEYRAKIIAAATRTICIGMTYKDENRTLCQASMPSPPPTTPGVSRNTIKVTETSKSSKGIIILVVFGIVAIILAVVITFLLYRNKKVNPASSKGGAPSGGKGGMAASSIDPKVTAMSSTAASTAASNQSAGPTPTVKFVVSSTVSHNANGVSSIGDGVAKSKVANNGSAGSRAVSGLTKSKVNSKISTTPKSKLKESVKV